MNFFSGILNGLGEIWAHKLRSFLTMLCVMLGVVSMVVITGFVEGMFTSWSKNLSERGGLEKVSTGNTEPPARQEAVARLSRGLTLGDALQLKRDLPPGFVVSPEYEVRTTLFRRGKRDWVRLQGTTSSILAINRYEVDRGRFFTELELRDSANVVVLGTWVAQRLFNRDEDPVGRFIDINGQPFKVVGVLKHYELMFRDWNTLRWKNDVAFIPITTGINKVGRNEKLAWINVQVDDVERLNDTVDTITNVLATRHNGIFDFKVSTSEGELASFAESKKNSVFFAGVIGAVTLIVSAIGIANLMLASINERVREIGIRKAIGATGRNIFGQFVVEAVALSLCGGLMGMAVSIGAIHGLQAMVPPENAPVLSTSAFVVGFIFSVIAGVLAGIYPALQASKLDPITALRYE
ncbi:MAG: ABC transporter permease [Verrucomicrobiota bacterium]